MTYSIWVSPDGKREEREYVQSYQDASKATPDMDYLRARLPSKDTVTGDWAAVPKDAKKFDWGRCRESANVPHDDGKEATDGRGD